MTETVDNYRPRIKFGNVVDGMRTELKEAGLMCPLPQQKFEIAIANEIDLTRAVVQGQLQRNWKRLFPGVEYSEELMLEKLDEALNRWKKEAFAKFEQLAQRDANVRLVKNILTGRNYFFRRWDVRLLFGAAASFLTFPCWISQILAPSDWQLSLGFRGFIFNLALLVYLFVQAYQNQKET